MISRLNIAPDKYRSFLRNTDANVAILTGFILPVLISSSALAVDLASAYLQRRTAQSVVDLAAMNAANHIDIAEAAAKATLDANTFGSINSIVVIKGNYTPDPTLAPNARFKPGQAPFNAVHVTLSKDARLYFARTFTKERYEIKVAAIAGAANEATFSVGSRLAALRGGLANTILNKLLGTTLELSVMDYNALANAEVRIDDLLNTINVQQNLHAASFSEVLDHSIAVNDLVQSAATIATADGSNSAAFALRGLAGTVSPSLKVPLNKLMNIGPYGAIQTGDRTPGLGATVSMLDMLRASAMIANGEHQVAVSLDLGVPGIAKLSLDLAIGERPQHSPWVAVGETGASVSTSQTKLRLVAEVLGSGALKSTSIKLPVYLELAYADASLSDISCGANQNDKTATVAVRPGVARAAIADVRDSELLEPDLWKTLRKADIVKTPLLKVSAKAVVDVGNMSATNLEFDQADVDDKVIKRANTNQFAESIVSSLVDETSFDISALGVINVSLVTPEVVRAVLAPVASTLDGVVSEILDAIGLSLGEADVRVHGIRCGGSNLTG